jgi:predicted transcriptional regulator
MSKGTQNSRKTESVTVRLDPKVRFALELLSRVEHRSVTGVVQAALESRFRNATIDGEEDGQTVQDFVGSVYRTDEVERFVIMADRAPQLLDFEERRLWESILATSDLWENTNGGRRRLQDLDIALLKLNWAGIKEFVREHADEATVPEIPGRLTCIF